MTLLKKDAGSNSKLIYSQVSPNTSTQMDAAKAHTIWCELTAVFPCLILLAISWVEQKAVALSTIFQGAKIVQIEQNTKEITFFLCIFEMQPIFKTSLKDTTNLSRIQIFEIISSMDSLFLLR